MKKILIEVQIIPYFSALYSLMINSAKFLMKPIFLILLNLLAVISTYVIIHIHLEVTHTGLQMSMALNRTNLSSVKFVTTEYTAERRKTKSLFSEAAADKSYLGKSSAATNLATVFR